MYGPGAHASKPIPKEEEKDSRGTEFVALSSNLCINWMLGDFVSRLINVPHGASYILLSGLIAYTKWTYYVK